MRQTRYIYSLLMAGMMFTPAIALAQSNDIMNRIDRLENEIQTLNRAMYRGEPPPVPQSPVMVDQNNQLLDRVNQMESDLRALTGRVEQQTYDIDQLKKQIETVTYDLQQARTRAATPIVSQSPEDMRPAPEQASADTQLAPDELGAPGDPLPQPQPGMRTATPTLPTGDNPTALYEASYNKIKTGEYEAAEAGFKKFLELYPDHKLAGNSYYWLGESYYVRGDYDQATRVFAQSYQKFPKGPKGPDNLLKLGLSLSAKGKVRDACVALMQLGKEYPAASPEVMATADKERQKLGC